MKKDFNIVVTGAKGQLGSYLVDWLREQSRLDGSRVGKVFGIDIDDVDLSYRTAVEAYFDSKPDSPFVKTDYVIHCAAATDTAAIERDPFSYYKANCLATKNVAEVCAKNGIKLIFISTDYVFSENSIWDGTRYQESPVNQYGMQKLVAELFAKEAFKDWQDGLLVLRSSWMFGNSSKSFVEKFLTRAFKTCAEAMAGGKATVQVVDDAFGKPTPTWLIAEAVCDYIKQWKSGEIDLQSTSRQISRYEWATMIWKSFVDSCHDANSAISEAIDKLKSTVTIAPCCSSSINIGMKHPGKVIPKGGHHNGGSTVDIERYQAATDRYVASKWHELAELAVEMLGIEEDNAKVL